MMQRLVLALAQSQGPRLSRAAPFVAMGQQDWYAAGAHYLATNPKVDPTKLERDVINSRLSAPQDTRSDDEKTQARRPRCAHWARCALHCAQGSVPAPFSALFTFLCSVHIWPSPAHTGPLHCAQSPVPAPFSAQLCAHLAQPCAHRCSAHTGPLHCA